MHDEQEINWLARDLYTIYCRAVDGHAWNGDPLPEWDTFANDPTKSMQAEKAVNAWRAVAQHALDMR
jgi:hypothetical protein